MIYVYNCIITLYKSQNNSKQCSDVKEFTPTSTLDSRLFQFSPNAVEAYNIFINIVHYYLGHLVLSLLKFFAILCLPPCICINTLACCSIFLYSVSSFLSRNICVAISCDIIEVIQVIFDYLKMRSKRFCRTISSDRTYLPSNVF